jgi:hypothetical protein
VVTLVLDYTQISLKTLKKASQVFEAIQGQKIFRSTVANVVDPDSMGSIRAKMAKNNRKQFVNFIFKVLDILF